MNKIFDDITVFDGKSLSNLFKDIYDNSNTKKAKIDDLIDQLQPFVVDMDSALIIVPIIKDYLDISVKNDDQLNKLCGIITRMISSNNKSDGSLDDGSEFILSEYDKKLIADEVEAQNKLKEELTEKEQEYKQWSTNDEEWVNNAETSDN